MHPTLHLTFAGECDIKTLAEAERVFSALAENGAVRMPLQKTFWSPAFGVLVDQFGTPWEINSE